MNLNKEQEEILRNLIKSGGSLADAQRTVNEEFEIQMTYMEVRFLVDDLNFEFQQEEEEEPEAEDAPVDEVIDPSGVQVEVDGITRPGAVVSGNVVFSDGVKCDWQMDTTGRLGLIPSEEGYQPPQEDIQEFQTQLQTELQRKGMA